MTTDQLSAAPAAAATHAGSGLRRRRAGAALVAAAAVVAAVLPWPVQPPPPGRAAIPARFADRSALTATQERAPLRRAIAVYHADGGSDLVSGHELLADADRPAVRRFAVDDGRNARGLLSPDGTRLAWSHTDGDRQEIRVQELATGAVRRHRVTGFAHLYAWSGDGRRLAFNPGGYESATGVGELAVLDLADGRERTVHPATAGPVAFHPTGDRLAVQIGRDLAVLDLTGAQLWRRPLPDGQDLAGPAAWSPDGALLVTRPAGDWAVVPPGTVRDLVFVDATGGGAAVPAPMAAGRTWWLPVLGWRSPTRLLVADAVVGPTPAGVLSPDHIAELSLTGDRGRARVAGFDGPPHRGVHDVQLATGLLADATVRPGTPDRGPWPGWLRALAVLAVAAPTLALLWWRARRRT